MAVGTVAAEKYHKISPLQAHLVEQECVACSHIIEFFATIAFNSITCMKQTFGKELAPHRIGKHSNPRSRAKIDQNTQKLGFSVFLCIFAPILRVGLFPILEGANSFPNKLLKSFKDHSFIHEDSFATRSACYRGRKPQSCPKWLGEGAKGVLVYVDKSLLRWCKRGWYQCKRLLGDLSPAGQNTFCTPLLTTWATLRFRASVAGTRGRKDSPNLTVHTTKMTGWTVGL